MKTIIRRKRPKYIKYNGWVYYFDEDKTAQFKNDPQDFKDSIILYTTYKNLYAKELFKQTDLRVYIFSKGRKNENFIYRKRKTATIKTF